jgi:hypothetical protein
MENTIRIQLINPKAIVLLRTLEELSLIKILNENGASTDSKLSNKYRGVFSKEDAESFNRHTETMRKEWDNT